MSKDTPEEIAIEFGLCRVSRIISDDLKAKMSEEEKSIVSWSKYEGNKNFFSAPLQQQVLRSKHGEIPSIMFLCIKQIYLRGMTEEGILRTSGNNLKIQKIRKLLQDGKRVDYDKIDVRTVASVLKLWLRELPTPLIPFSHYSELMALGGTVTRVTENEKMACMDKVKRVIATIPNPEWNCLRVLMTFLHKVRGK